MMEQYEKDKTLIPEGNLVEVEFEELEARPLTVLKKIFTVLNIPGFETVRGGSMKQLQKEKQYSKFKYEYNDETFKKIEKRWGKYIYQWHEKAWLFAGNSHN